MLLVWAYSTGTNRCTCRWIVR